MIKCRIVQLKSNHNHIRTSMIEGFCQIKPDIGRSFSMFSRPLDPHQDLRVFRSSPVKTIRTEEDGLMIFTTENSTYQWREIL